MGLQLTKMRITGDCKKNLLFCFNRAVSDKQLHIWLNIFCYNIKKEEIICLISTIKSIYLPFIYLVSNFRNIWNMWR